MFGLTNSEGNHGEDVKEYYFYLDSTPTHSYMKYLYKYPQRAYPYEDLIKTNRQRSRNELEYELLDTGVFDHDRYFDVFVEYAKAAPEDLLIKISICNRGPEPAALHVLPTLWFRNTWSWSDGGTKPLVRALEDGRAPSSTRITPIRSSRSRWRTTICTAKAMSRCFSPKTRPTTRDFSAARTHRRTSRMGSTSTSFMARRDAVNPGRVGTKAAAHYELTVPAAQSRAIRLRLTKRSPAELPDAFADFDEVLEARLKEADEFYAFDHLTRRQGGPGSDERCAAGARGDVVEQAVLLLRWRPMAGGPPGSSAPRGQPPVAQQRLVPHDQRRHPVDAGQVGVPLVRRMGPRLSHVGPVGR